VFQPRLLLTELNPDQYVLGSPARRAHTSHERAPDPTRPAAAAALAARGRWGRGQPSQAVPSYELLSQTTILRRMAMFNGCSPTSRSVPWPWVGWRATGCATTSTSQPPRVAAGHGHEQAGSGAALSRPSKMLTKALRGSRLTK
jgi:hypothetical protein